MEKNFTCRQSNFLFASKVLGVFVLLFFYSQYANAQAGCNAGSSSGSTLCGGSAVTATCSPGASVALGAGEYRTMATTNGVVYTFTYAAGSNSQANGMQINGNAVTTGTVNYTGNGSTWNIGINRNSIGWSGNSATLSYMIAVPTAPTVGATQNICGATLTSNALGGNSPGIGSGLWSFVSGPGSITSYGSGQSVGNTQITVNAYGNYVFKWSITNGGCASSPASASISVNIGNTPTSNAGTTVNQCQTTGTTAFTISNSAAAGGSYSGVGWTYSAGTGTGSITANPATLTPTFTPTSTSGNGTLTLTTTGTYGCAGTNPTSTVALNWGQTPTVNAGSTVNKCQTTGTTAFALSNGASDGGTFSGINWTYSAGTGTGSITANPGTLTPTFTPTTTSGNGTLTLTATGSLGCAGNNPTATVAVNWGQTPTVNAGSTINQCQATGTTAFALSNGATDGGTFSGINWTYTSATGTGSVTSGGTTLTPTFTPTTISGNGTLTLTATGSLGCVGTNPSTTVALNWGQTPTVNAGSTVNKCQATGTTAFALSNGASDGGTFSGINWTYSAGTGTGSITANAGTLTPTFTPTTISGNGTLTLTATGTGGCAGTNPTSTVALNWAQTPTVGAGSTVNTCQATGTTAFALSNGASDGGTFSGINWTYSAGTGTGSITANAGTLTPTFTPTTISGNGTLTLTATGSGGCAGTNPTSTVALNWGQTPTVSAGTTVNQCQATGTTAFSLSNGASDGGTFSGINWTYTAGAGTGSVTSGGTTLTPTFTPTTISGNGTLTLTATGTGGCAGTNPTSTVAVNWGQTPVVNAGTTVNQCQATGTTAFTVSNGASNSGTSSAITWTYSAGAGTGSITANSGTLTPTFTPTTISGNGTLTLTATGSGGCTGTNPGATVALNWGQTPVVGAGSTVNQCQTVGATAFTLSNGATNSGTFIGINWTYSAGTGTGSVTSGGTTLTPTFTPTSTSGNGTLTLTATGSGGCAGTNPSSTVAVNWGQTPTANAGSAVTSCAASGTPVALSNGASDGGTFGSIGWTYTTGTGTGSITSGSTTLTPTFTPTSLSGNGTLTLTVNGSLGCVGTNPTSTTTITWTTSQTATVGSNQTVCQGGTSTGLGGNTPSVGSGLWTCTAAPGGGSTSDISFSSASSPGSTATAAGAAVPGDYTLQWTITNGPCSPTSASLTLHVAGQPTASTGASQSVCPGGTTSSLGGNTPPAGGSGLWTCITAPSGGNTAHITFSDATSETATATASSSAVAGNYTLKWTVSNSPCSSASATMILVVAQQPSISAQPGISLLCQGGTGNLGIAVTGGVNPAYQWQYFDGSSFVNVTDGTPTGVTYGGTANSATLNFAASGSSATGSFNYQVIVTYTAGSGCTPNTLTSTSGGSNGIVDIGTPVAILINPAANTSICAGNTTSLTAAATGGTVLSYQWQYYNGSSYVNVVNNSPTGITYGGTGTSATLNITTSTSTAASTYLYKCVVNSLGNNCTSATSSVANLTVNQGPTTAPGSNTPLCYGTTLNLNAHATPGSNATLSYAWAGPASFPSFAPGNTATPTVTNVNTNMAGTYQVTVTDGNTCSASGSTVVAINPALSAVATLAGCSFVDSAHLFVSVDTNLVIVTASGGTAPYTVTPPASHELRVAVSSSVTEYSAPANNTAYTYTLTDAASCSVTSNSITTLNGNPTNIPYTATSGNEMATCYDKDFGKWLTFNDASNKAIIAIYDSMQDLGQVSVTIYKDATTPEVLQTGTASNCTGYYSTAMQRHFVITSTAAQPFSRNVKIRLYFSNTEMDSLKLASQANHVPGFICTDIDDVKDLNDLYVTKYDDPRPSHPTVNGNYGDNISGAVGGIYKVYGNNTQFNTQPNGPLAKDSLGFSAIYPNAQDHHYVQLAVKEFSELWLNGSEYYGTPLPVEMLFLEAEGIDNSYIQVRWATATEVNNNHFDIERSSDGQTWGKIGQVEGHGNSTTEQDYSYNDNSVNPNVRYYYRLKQVDNNGDSKFTDVVTAIIYSEATFSIRDFVPNPTSGHTNLLITATKAQEVGVEIFDVIGRKVVGGNYALYAGANQIEFNLANLSSGTYTAVVTSANELYTKKLVITH